MTELLASNYNLHNLGVLDAKMPFDLFTELLDHINDLPDDVEKFNPNLLGHMKEEYSLNGLKIKERLAPFIEGMAYAYSQSNEGYISGFEEAVKSQRYELYLDSLWVNKQKKYEFNPVHHHAGVLSFVIWTNVPYDLAEEEKYFPQTSLANNGSYTSKFCFVYSDILGRIQHLPLPIDKTWEGKIVMFPASLHHCVYPFYTSDDYRISVSGNIRIRGSNDKSI